MSQLRYHHLWNPHLQSISSQASLQLGSRYKSTSLLLGVRINSSNVVNKFVPSTEIEFQNSTGTVHYQVHYKLKTSGKQTLVSCVTTVSTSGSAFVFTAPILKRLARRELQTDLQALKLAVEHQLK